MIFLYAEYSNKLKEKKEKAEQRQQKKKIRQKDKALSKSEEDQQFDEDTQKALKESVLEARNKETMQSVHERLGRSEGHESDKGLRSSSPSTTGYLPSPKMDQTEHDSLDAKTSESLSKPVQQETSTDGILPRDREVDVHDGGYSSSSLQPGSDVNDGNSTQPKERLLEYRRNDNGGLGHAEVRPVRTEQPDIESITGVACGVDSRAISSVYRETSSVNLTDRNTSPQNEAALNQGGSSMQPFPCDLTLHDYTVGSGQYRFPRKDVDKKAPVAHERMQTGSGQDRRQVSNDPRKIHSGQGGDYRGQVADARQLGSDAIEYDRNQTDTQREIRSGQVQEDQVNPARSTSLHPQDRAVLR